MKNFIVTKALNVLLASVSLLLGLVSCVSCMHELGWPRPFVFNTTASMPRGVWVLEAERARPLQRGEIVALRPPTSAIDLGCVRPGHLLLKYVVGTPGDRVCVRGGDVWLGARVIATTRASRTPQDRCVTLAKGQLWVATPHERSCDSRFFGPIPDTLVRARAYAWLTWERGQGSALAYPPSP